VELFIRLEYSLHEDPKIDDLFKLSGFAFGGEEKIDGKNSRIVAYVIRTEEGRNTQAKLWLDEKGIFPLKRELRGKYFDTELVITETYSEQSLEEIPDREFEHGK
jgi:outer membrane lipoprotein-sorting protein